MKTFLWTTLFWIVAAIAGLLCLGFGNLGTQVLENGWLANIMPKNLQSKVCDSVVATAMEGIDWCTVAEANDCNSKIEDSEIKEVSDDSKVQESLENIIANQQIIYSYLQESFANTNQTINNMQVNVQEPEQLVIDEKEQQRLQLQAQIEALQNEMASL